MRLMSGALPWLSKRIQIPVADGGRPVERPLGACCSHRSLMWRGPWISGASAYATPREQVNWQCVKSERPTRQGLRSAQSVHRLGVQLPISRLRWWRHESSPCLALHEHDPTFIHAGWCRGRFWPSLPRSDSYSCFGYFGDMRGGCVRDFFRETRK